MRHPSLLPLALLLVVLCDRTASAQQPAPASPCADSLYQELKGRPLAELSEREYQYFVQRDKGCVEYQALRSLVERPAPRPERPPPTTRTRAQGSSLVSGADILVTNTSDVPIVVNTVRVFDCVNLRHASCGVHHPKVEIRPGMERRVFTIRFATPDQRSSYRYEYHVSVVER